jgi:hypothetical protein
MSSRARRLVEAEKKEIDEQLAFAIDIDQVILIRAEWLDESLGRVANLDSLCYGIRDDVKRSADLLKRVHERLSLVEATIDASCGFIHCIKVEFV